jgi:hypothetical protein
MHAALLFPPGADPRSPHLSLASLTAHLRGHGVEVTQRDLDVEAVHELLRPAELEQAVKRADTRRSKPTSPAERLRLDQVLLCAERTVALAPGALDVLRDPKAFYDPMQLVEAREAVSHGLRLLSAGAGVVWDIAPVSYEIEGVDSAQLADLDRATADAGLNVFEQLWSSGVLADLARDRPDVVGVSILNHQQILPGLTLARRCKAAGHRVVLGGTVYAKFADAIMARPRFLELFCDVLVPYEGETALLAVLERVAAGRELSGAPNTIALNASGSPVAGPVRAEDVATLPTPDFTGLPLHLYLTPVPVLPILTGKGCYFNKCRFCDIPFINEVAPLPYRTRPPATVADDIATLAERHGARHFEITDEALPPRFLLRLGDELARRELDVSLVGYARLERGFDADTCTRLAAMGVRKLFFGLESGSQRTLDHMAKGIRVAEASRVLRAVHDAGIAVHLFSMVGFPEETEADARETLNFLLDHADVLAEPQHSFDVHGFSLDLRTEYFDDAERFGIEIDHAELARTDFPVSVAAWWPSRGLPPDRADELRAEFQATLRSRFPVHRQFPAHLWPSFEEYSILYADHYAQRPFSWRLCLPSPGDPLAFVLRWPRSVAFHPVDGGYVAQSFTGSVPLPAAMLQLLSRPGPAASVDDMLDAVAARIAPAGTAEAGAAALVAGLRRLIDQLLAAGVLWLVPADTGVEVAT